MRSVQSPAVAAPEISRSAPHAVSPASNEALASPDQWGLAGYLDAVYGQVARAIDTVPMHETQRSLLHASTRPAHDRARQEPLGDPLCTVYLLGLAGQRTASRAWHHLGAFIILYILALDLLDDVQDDDLDGTPFEGEAPGVALNTGLALLFLAQEELRRAGVALPSASDALHELASCISLRAVTGQHRDLIGALGATTPDEVLAMQRDKTSSLSLLTESAAILAAHDEADRAHLRAFGESFAMFIQVRDDLRDVYGKALSPDLAQARRTYPVACFYEVADAEQRRAFDEALSKLPDAMPTLRRLLYQSGAVQRAATTLESLRRDMHTRLASVRAPGAAGRRTMLDVVDGLARSVYQVPELHVTRQLWSPSGAWHDRVREEQQRFCDRVEEVGLSTTPPRLRPWAQAHWMFVPEANTIFYPDLESLAPDVLAFQATLLGTDDLKRLEAIMVAQLPVVMAHEMFHFWRHACGRLSRDHWHEEWVANRCAIAYGQRFAPEAVAQAQRLAEQVEARHGERLDETAKALLRSCQHEDPSRTGYAMDMTAVAVVTLAMVDLIVADRPELDREVGTWLKVD